MASGSSTNTYGTRRRTRLSVESKKVSRVDRRRTRLGFLSHLQDSDSGDESDPRSCCTNSDSESQGDHSDGDIEDSARSGKEDRPPAQCSDGKEDGDEEGVVVRPHRKRTSTSVLMDSSSESDSDVCSKPIRKVAPKRRFCRFNGESDFESGPDSPTASSTQSVERKEDMERVSSAKRKLRQTKLEELLKQRRRRRSSNTNVTLEDSSEEEEEEEVVSLAPVGGSSSEGDDDSLKDFIVDDEEQEEETSGPSQPEQDSEPPKKSFLSHHLPLFSSGCHFTHFQVVVKALLINALDETFLKSLHDGSRTKKYAQEMKNSLYYFDQRFILPRLENLKQRSRWRERYKERVECYPVAKVLMTGVHAWTCEACELHRHSRFSVCLSGQLYDSRTLQSDTFMPDDRQCLRVGNVCAQRTQVYHRLRHFKYHLFKMCCSELKSCAAPPEETVKDTVSRTFAELEERGWIREKYEMFEDYLNDADLFQEECLD
ncbi:coiled-coil domain-containing protein 82 [Amia ocellicauda]|uniref:coiled-coil domain-containing protein 82 n=1 Tax=Amia ocellicauda TaxID=2972642 RepID=UPI0034645337